MTTLGALKVVVHIFMEKRADLGMHAEFVGHTLILHELVDKVDE